MMEVHLTQFWILENLCEGRENSDAVEETKMLCVSGTP